MALHGRVKGERADQTIAIRPHLAPPDDDVTVPRYRLPRTSLPAETAYQIVHDELMLDGNARLNLATFVTTWMDEHADRLMAECAAKNMVDKDEYPQTAELETRCVNILADLWHAPDAANTIGCSTTGSSEACMLAGLALLRRWRAASGRQGAHRPGPGAGAGAGPNLVMGANVQICWEKFARYWDVEARLVPLAPGRTHLTADEAAAHCDENTIGVVAVLGSTFDGTYEPVEEIAAALDRLAADGGPDVPIHVDAASGGFIAPFCDPALRWDFRLERVASINTSGHKYGLVYPGVGWVVWRDTAHLPAELVFDVDYLGGSMPTFALNFSRPGAQVVAQYYSLLRLGRSGYELSARTCRDNARWLADEVAKLGPFELVSDGSGIPAFAFTTRDGTGFDVFDVSAALRTHGWLVPAYRFPADLTDLAVLRIVVRADFSRDLAHLLVNDLHRVVERLGGQGSRPAGTANGTSRVSGVTASAAFHH